MEGKVKGHKGPPARSFHGRAGRVEWAIGMARNTVLGAVVGAVPGVGPALALPWLVGALAVTSRRLHDMRLSGWLQILPMLGAVPFAVYVGAESAGALDAAPILFRLDGPIGSLAALIWIIVYAVFYAILAFVPGANGPNAYGEADIKA